MLHRPGSVLSETIQQRTVTQVHQIKENGEVIRGRFSTESLVLKERPCQPNTWLMSVVSRAPFGVTADKFTTGFQLCQPSARKAGDTMLLLPN